MNDVPRLFRVMIEVPDSTRAATFYGELFANAGRKVGGGRHYFDRGSVIFALVDVSEAGRSAQEIAGDLYFAVDDLEAVHARARELGCLSKGDVHDESGGEIVRRPWGERSFYAEDPFGNGLCFVDASTLFTG